MVRALAGAGLVAVAPDLNGAYTGGWGEPDDRARWGRIINRTLTPLIADATNGGATFGVELGGKVDPGRIGVLGHSLSGFHAVRLALKRRGNTGAELIAAGKGPISSAFLLTPVARSGKLPDIETAVVLAACDGDTGDEGRRYITRARRGAGRGEAVFMPTLRRANHNYFNRTLAGLGQDDAVGMRGKCRAARRLGAPRQQKWLAAVATDFFATTLLGERRPRWLRLRGRLPKRIKGRGVAFERFVP